MAAANPATCIHKSVSNCPEAMRQKYFCLSITFTGASKGAGTCGEGLQAENHPVPFFVQTTMAPDETVQPELLHSPGLHVMYCGNAELCVSPHPGRTGSLVHLGPW